MSQPTLTYIAETRGGGQPLQGSPGSLRVDPAAARSADARAVRARTRRCTRSASSVFPDRKLNIPAHAPLARFVVQVAPSREDAAARRVAALGGDAVQTCFPLRRQMLRKKAGAWNYALEPLFPGYLFLASDNPEAVDFALRRSTQPDLMLGADGRLATLSDAEAALVHALADAQGVVRSSRGRIVEGDLVVESGPLVGLEELVRRVDRHHRAAWLDPSRAAEVLLGADPSCAAASALPTASHGIKVGLEVVSKS